MATIVAMVAALSGFGFAESITGTVINKTNNKPAAGDDVVLIRLEPGHYVVHYISDDSLC